MELVVFLLLFFPVFFSTRYFIRLPEFWTDTGIHSLIAVIITFGSTVGFFWLKDKIWG